MLKELDTKNVGMEMDIFWIVNAGYDPLKYFAQNPGRFEQWHIKDMDKSDKNKNANVGTGSIDFKSDLRCGKTIRHEALVCGTGNLSRRTDRQCRSMCQVSEDYSLK
jgi:sugar phosphate isomerase/epimerase